MLSNSLGTVNNCHWRFKLVLSLSKTPLFLNIFGEEKEISVHLFSRMSASEYVYGLLVYWCHTRILVYI